VLGASGRIDEDVIRGNCQADGVPILRRASGGGTVVLGPGALNVSVILPESAAPGLAAVDRAQHYVLEWIAGSLVKAGVPVSLDGRGDLVIADRKCGGSAQRRLKNWFMVHCSILYDFSIERIIRYLAIPRRQPDYRRGRDHRDFLSNVDVPRTILVEAIRGGCGCRPLDAADLAGALAMVPTLMDEKFANRDWIERF
jgi:lipoate-protein ligase A